jgi:hypothetical protein
MIHLQKFIDRVQGADARGLKDINIGVSDAKAMHAEITRLLLELENLKQTAVQQPKEEVIQVSVNGGSFL